MLEKKNNSTLIMVAIFIATFMTSIEATIVTTALPTIISELKGLSMQSWVFSAYLLTSAISTPIYGKLADTIGRKKIFLGGIILFCLGSFLCGIAPNIQSLIIFRAIQGLGTGAIMPITFTIIADLFSYEKRSSKIAFNNTAWGISALFGPLVGGFIVEKLNWHWIFFINLPLGLIVALIILFSYQEITKVKSEFKIDYRGIVLLSITLLLVLLLFQALGTNIKIGEIVIFALAIIIFSYFFIKTEYHVMDPIIPLDIFKNRTFTIQIVTALVLSGVQMAYQIYFPIWLQSVYSLSPSMAGLAITPSSIMWLVGSFFVGMLITKYAPRTIIMPLIIIQALCYLPLVFAATQFPQIFFYIIAATNGLIMGVIITTNTVISQRLVPKENLGTASSMFTLGRTLGQTIMTSVFGLVFNASTQSQLKQYSDVSINQISNDISTVTKGTINGHLSSEINQIIINNMHSIFMIVILLFVIVFIANYLDNKKSIVE
ncbi:MFS transporter [Companilactobacillus sp. RD055328]|nr:DHA2 family efflux MFS transporter permease subunit [Companilactobacillus sp. RD055328]GKQ42197.1 MFS transporter [Companilactobacillus sp. RD055328]